LLRQQRRRMGSSVPSAWKLSLMNRASMCIAIVSGEPANHSILTVGDMELVALDYVLDVLSVTIQ
jgi:hypothetical protein